jgi:signal transduction histidine kinase
MMLHDGERCPGSGLERDESPSHYAALPRIIRRLTDEADPSVIARYLLDDAVTMLRADWGSVAGWHEDEGVLKRIWSTYPLPGGKPIDIYPGQGVGGQSIVLRRPVISNNYASDDRAIVQSKAVGIQAAMAAPLVRDGRLLGVIMLGSFDQDRNFSDADAEALELLAGVAASLVDGLRRARLEGALLLARTAQHHLNNQLTLTVGYADMVASDPRLPPDLREYVEQILEGAQQAAATVDQLRRVTRLEEIEAGSPSGPMINLTRSVEEQRPA